MRTIHRLRPLPCHERVKSRPEHKLLIAASRASAQHWPAGCARDSAIRVRGSTMISGMIQPLLLFEGLAGDLPTSGAAFPCRAPAMSARPVRGAPTSCRETACFKSL
jgi:hypothetical protein